MSPERKKKSPLEIGRMVEAKQRRAELQREQLERDRLLRLAKVQGNRQAVQRQEQDRAAKLAQCKTVWKTDAATECMTPRQCPCTHAPVRTVATHARRGDALLRGFRRRELQVSCELRVAVSDRLGAFDWSERKKQKNTLQSLCNINAFRHPRARRSRAGRAGEAVAVAGAAQRAPEAACAARGGRDAQGAGAGVHHRAGGAQPQDEPGAAVGG
eukprot:9504127-Pyramimonas_sp.AAC.2